MSSLKDLVMKPPKILLMGAYGTGKTALATTLGKYAQIIDLDDGLLTAARFQDSHTSERFLIDVVSCLEEDPAKAVAMTKFQEHLKNIVKQCSQKTYPYKALIIDGLTNLVDFALRRIMQEAGSLTKAIEIQHWGGAFRLVEDSLFYLKSLPIVVIVIAHTMIDNVGGINKEILACPGQKLPPKILTKFDEAWRMEIAGANDYIIRTQRSITSPARTRVQLPDKTPASKGMIAILKDCGYDIEKA